MMNQTENGKGERKKKKLYQSHILICCEKELNCKIIRVRFVELKGLPDVLTITRDKFLSENDMKSFLRCQQQQK